MPPPFAIANGVLRFQATPDYEDLNNPDKAYDVTVQASDGTRTGTLVVMVSVADALGTVTLPPAQPQVGVALSATVSDLDGVDPAPATPDAWCWARSAFPTFPPDPSTEDIDCDTTTTDTYTPVSDDLGRYLRATVEYTDGQGTPKAQEIFAVTVESVLPAPSRPSQPIGGGSRSSGGGGGGGGATEEPPPTEPVGYLENPGPAPFQSSIGVLSGWVCEAEVVEVEINGVSQPAAYGTERLDTREVCGDTDNGFGLLFNWNRLGDGEHEVVTRVDGVELSRVTVWVTTLGEEFVRDVAGTCEVADFPSPGETVTLVWQQNSQNFVLAGGAVPSGVNQAGTPGVGYLENPGPNSFQSGVGVLSGWVCEADEVTLTLGNLPPQGAGYGTERLDTEAACGDTDNGFGLLFNWNRLGDGEHEVVAYVDDEELGRATVQVTTLGEEFVRGAEGMCEVADFPMDGETVTLEWQQTSQNFVVTGVE